ncbi:hypothetical protein FGF1_12950 [Flavobacteriaceae bacterium GF1]
MKVLTLKKDIKKQHDRLVRLLQPFADEEILALTGHQGNSFNKEVKYSKELDIWWDMGDYSEGNSGVRYWNAFGIGKPKPNKLAYIVCEINYPLEGINKRIAANWVRDGKDMLLVHNGNIGGGRKGVGKSGFIEHYNGTFERVDAEGLSDEVTILGNLNDFQLPYQIKNFVYEVDRIKKLIVQRKFPTEITLAEQVKHSFNEEFVGTKEYMGKKGRISVTANHGLVVRHLKEKIEERGWLVANDQQRDLYVYNKKGKIETVFEVKTSFISQTIFTGVGQLYVNSARLNPWPKMIFVIPEKPNRNLTKTFKKLNIKILVYTWDKDKPKFKNIDKIF